MREWVVRLFWATLIADAILLWILGPRLGAEGGTDSYAVGLGAFLYYALFVLFALVSVLFHFVRWLPLRIVLTGAAIVAALFLVVNIIDPWWW